MRALQKIMPRALNARRSGALFRFPRTAQDLVFFRKAVERLTEENEILRRAGKTEKGA